jgi:CubicO group peptidase (beta-lactamase class C family)
MRLASGVLALAVLAAPALAQAPAAAAKATARAGWSAEKEKEVAAAVEKLRADQGIPGIGAAVALGGELVWAAGFGQSDVENAVPVTNATTFRLGSISKPISAVAAMQLVEQGKLDLDAEVQRYVPAFPKKPWPITTRQLLAHLAGIRHYQGDEFDSIRRYSGVTEGLDIFKDDPLLYEPGTKYSYSTYGYSLVGAVVEAAAGRPFVPLLHDAVFVPAGMTTARDDDARAIIPGRAQGYFKGPDGGLQNSEPADTSYKIPGGGIIATATDVARFGAAFLEGRLVRPATVATMLTPVPTRDGVPHAYGLGFSSRSGPPREAWHTGGQQRISTALYLRPDSGVVVVVLTNLEDAPGRVETARRIAEIVER